MAHNFVHSFLSYTNYSDGGFVVEDLLECARALNPEEKLFIQFIPSDKADDSGFSERVKKSITSYRKWFPEHCQSHNIDPEAIKLFQASLVKNALYQILGYAIVIDDKGRKYEKNMSASNCKPALRRV